MYVCIIIIIIIIIITIIIINIIIVINIGTPRNMNRTRSEQPVVSRKKKRNDVQCAPCNGYRGVKINCLTVAESYERAFFNEIQKRNPKLNFNDIL